jgi:hypothetical protein
MLKFKAQMKSKTRMAKLDKKFFDILSFNIHLAFACPAYRRQAQADILTFEIYS